MSIKRDVVTVTTASGGDATSYTSEAFDGNVLVVKYTKTDYANGVDFTITTETTEENIWVDTNINASETVRPRAVAQGTDGANLAWYVPVVCAGERIKIVIASGGDTKTGVFSFIIDEVDYIRR